MPLTTAEYLELARTLTRDAFVACHPECFLLKRPVRDQPAAPVAHFRMATSVATTDVDPYQCEWQVLPIVKRPGNAFPKLITVGRATNCDIVVRAPSISKVHAQFSCDTNGAISLHDNRPSNPIVLNSAELSAGETQPLRIGDVIRLGTIEFEFVDAARLFDVLRAEAENSGGAAV